MNTTESIKMLPEEIELKRLDKVLVTMTTFLSYKKLFEQNIIITNKRIMVINSMTPSLNLPLSLFYSKADFNNSNKASSILLINTEQKGDETILVAKGVWGLFKTKWIINSTDIVSLIKNNQAV